MSLFSPPAPPSCSSVPEYRSEDSHSHLGDSDSDASEDSAGSVPYLPITYFLNICGKMCHEVGTVPTGTVPIGSAMFKDEDDALFCCEDIV